MRVPPSTVAGNACKQQYKYGRHGLRCCCCAVLLKRDIAAASSSSFSFFCRLYLSTPFSFSPALDSVHWSIHLSRRKRTLEHWAVQGKRTHSLDDRDFITITVNPIYLSKPLSYRLHHSNLSTNNSQIPPRTPTKTQTSASTYERHINSYPPTQHRPNPPHSSSNKTNKQTTCVPPSPSS